MSVTEADRARAAEAWEEARDLGVVEAVAAALAEEREKVRAPFLALVAFYDRHEYSTLNVDDLRQILKDS